MSVAGIARYEDAGWPAIIATVVKPIAQPLADLVDRPPGDLLHLEGIGAQDALRRGDQVVTQGGLIGKVAKVKDDKEIEVELAEGVKVRVVKQTIAQVLSKTEPAES